jgi:hypothetical protein
MSYETPSFDGLGYLFAMEKEKEIIKYLYENAKTTYHKEKDSNTVFLASTEIYGTELHDKMKLFADEIVFSDIIPDDVDYFIFDDSDFDVRQEKATLERNLDETMNLIIPTFVSSKMNNIMKGNYDVKDIQ